MSVGCVQGIKMVCLHNDKIMIKNTVMKCNFLSFWLILSSLLSPFCPPFVLASYSQQELICCQGVCNYSRSSSVFGLYSTCQRTRTHLPTHTHARSREESGTYSWSPAAVCVMRKKQVSHLVNHTFAVRCQMKVLIKHVGKRIRRAVALPEDFYGEGISGQCSSEQTQNVSNNASLHMK